MVATVSRVVDYGTYVKLDEYDEREGLIHISEIASTWVKNIRDYVREGQKLVLKVLRVSPQKSQIDLSLRRVTGREKAEKMLEWKKEGKALSILMAASEKLGADKSAEDQVKQAILEKYGSLFDIFEEAVEVGEDPFLKLNINSDWAKALAEVAKAKIKIEKAKVRSSVELTCPKPNGVEAIKSALLSAQKARKPKGAEIKVYAVGAPKYRIEVLARNYAEAESTLKAAVQEALTTIQNLGGEGRQL